MQQGVTGKRTSVQPAVRHAVASLRNECLQSPPGTLLGQEDDLLGRYKVSRPTLRQAAALVGQEQLLRVQRGVGGGYFSHRPDVSGVTHMAAILLQLEGAHMREILQSTEAIRTAIIPLAASNMSTEAREELREFLDREAAIPSQAYDFVTFLRAERKHNDIIGRASGNSVLTLFMKISLELVSSLSKEEDVLFGKAERFLEWRSQRNRMLQAVLDGDHEVALIEAKRCSDKVRKWLAADKSKAQDEMTVRIAHVEG